ncbi:uncharacterized protein LOC119572163 [Penaeus monodon]|uniref:uncharacterized protein LOC119572163 n=1 Tax=Penaeus monodon TaxID=6687 RepID=UPI0018A7CE97|nr:uncharacterized protein LOC119572163 [Penaeus monodon]
MARVSLVVILIVGMTTARMESEDSLARSGLVFVPYSKVTYTSTVQIVPVKIKQGEFLDPFLKIGQKLKETEDSLKKLGLSEMNYGETNRKPEKNERIVIADTIVTIIDNMRKNIDNHMTTIRDFFRSVHQGRQKRSLWEGLNLVSNVAGLIMGGVTNHRIDMLHTQIMESDKLAQRAIEMAGVTTSLLDTVIIRENEIARALERMDEAIGVIDVVVTDLGRRLQLLEKIFLCSSVLENYRAYSPRSRGKPKFNFGRVTGSKRR